MDSYAVNFRIKKRWVRTALIVLVTAMIVAPITAYAADRFTDVPDSNTFHDDISWLADADVTKGCNPPANTQYCPSDNVTRGQMAAFLRRLAENQVVDAGTLDGQDSTAYETIVRSTFCEFATATECPDVSGDVANPTVVLSLQVNAPQGGILSIDSHYQTNDLHVKWLTVDNSCGPFIGTSTFTPNGVPGTVSSDIFASPDSTSVSAGVQVGAGNHTVRLCAASADPIAVAATLTASWTAGTGGTPIVAEAGGGGLDPALVEAVNAAFGG